MAVTFLQDDLNAHIAPGVADFTIAVIPDMSDWHKESDHWVANFFLNSTLRGRYAFPMQAYAYNYLRRAQYAFGCHARAREVTLAFLGSGRQSPTRYAEALFHWECFLGQSWHALALLVTAWDGTAFKKNDGTMEQRLNALYNQMKHVESRIDNGQILPEASVPVWLENAGLVSIDTRLTWDETAEILKEIAKYAGPLSDPLTAKERIKAIDA